VKFLHWLSDWQLLNMSSTPRGQPVRVRKCYGVHNPLPAISKFEKLRNTVVLTPHHLWRWCDASAASQPSYLQVTRACAVRSFCFLCFYCDTGFHCGMSMCCPWPRWECHVTHSTCITLPFQNPKKRYTHTHRPPPPPQEFRIRDCGPAP
jgi:hypothetical protein